MHLLLLFFAGVLVAVLFDAMTRLVTAHTFLSRSTAFPLVVLALLSVIGLAAWLQWSTLTAQFDSLVQELVDSVSQLKQWAQHTSWGRAALREGTGEEAIGKAEDALPQLTSFFTSAFGALADMVIVAFIGLYVAASPQAYVNGALRLLPGRHRARAIDVMGEIASRLRWWLAARFLTMTMVGVITAVGLWLLGVSLALPLGVLAGILDFIPFVGPVVAVIPAMLVAGAQEPMLAVWVGVLSFATQMLEAYVIIPLVQHHTVSIEPALLIAMVVVFGTWQGMLGVLLAAPLTAMGMVLVQRLYVEDVLGEQ
jgi:predicted PurR-regulated permease PerM